MLLLDLLVSKIHGRFLKAGQGLLRLLCKFINIHNRYLPRLWI